MDLEKALEKETPDKLLYKLYDKLAGCYIILKQYKAVSNWFRNGQISTRVQSDK